MASDDVSDSDFANEFEGVASAASEVMGALGRGGKANHSLDLILRFSVQQSSPQPLGRIY